VYEEVSFGILGGRMLASYAEKAGFDSIFLPDHLVGVGIKKFDAFDAWCELSAIAVTTKRIRIGTCVSDLHRRHPAQMAQTLMTVDHISNGRVIMGVGAGEAMNLNPYGISWDKPASRTREALIVIKKLLSEESVDYKGSFFELRRAFIQPKPIQKPHPPIWIGAHSPRTMRITAELGDGWIPSSPVFTPETYKKGFENIKRMAEGYGRNPHQITGAIDLLTLAAEDYETARKIIEFPAKFYALWLPRFMETLKLDIPNVEEFRIDRLVLNSETGGKWKETAEKVPFDTIEEFYLFGSPEDCIDGIEKFIKAGVKHFVLSIMTRPRLVLQALLFYREKVISYFKD